MRKKNFRLYGGKRKEGGGIEIGFEVEEGSPIVHISGEVVGKKPENIFKNIRNLPQEFHPFGISLARVVLSDLTQVLGPGGTNIDDTTEMEMQGPNIIDAVTNLQEANISSRQAAKFVFLQLRNAGMEADQNVVFRQVQIRYGEINSSEPQPKLTEATTFHTKTHTISSDF